MLAVLRPSRACWGAHQGSSLPAAVRQVSLGATRVMTTLPSPELKVAFVADRSANRV